MKQGVKLLRLNSKHGLFLCNSTLIDKIAGNLKSCLCGSLAISGLKHIELAVFNSKLHILHILIIALESACKFCKLFIYRRHLLLKMADWRWSTNACNNILALRIYKIFAHELLLAGCGVSGKCNSGSGSFS